MKDEKLFVYMPKSKIKYSSYKGEIENIFNRKFIVNKPYKQALTDITEFALKDGKVYLSPLIDCFDGSPITWRIGKSPNSELTNKMLKNAHKIIGNCGLLIHSDRGFHYRIDSWIKLMEQYGYKRSMSKRDVLQTIQCVKVSLEQLKMSSFIQMIGNIQHVIILLLN